MPMENVGSRACQRNPGLEFANSFWSRWNRVLFVHGDFAPWRSKEIGRICWHIGVSDGNGLSRNDISGSRNDISGSRNDISGSRNDISGSRNDVRVANDVSGRATTSRVAQRRSGSRNDVRLRVAQRRLRSRNDVSGSRNDVSGSRNDVPGRAMTAGGLSSPTRTGFSSALGIV